PMDNENSDVPIDSYKKNFKGTISFISIAPTNGEMKLAFQLLLPGMNFDLSHSGKGPGSGWDYYY
ncbi:MAG TPA: hypothetical protein VGW31_07620, partial [Hanamia sp.]|nr:hypothetical protein [Hanamia sp.]